ncbi:hypothetical protein KEM55_004697 [Ascosphaera atra]|nr:hypothetical protein KEM55_004697 [Ascosphaera atra]
MQVSINELPKEKETGEFTLDGFDSETVEAMVDWLYAGDYDYPSDLNEPCPKYGGRALFDTAVNALGDYLSIPRLCRAANTKIRNSMNAHWTHCVEYFAEVAQSAFDNSNDAELHQVLACVAHAHLEDVIHRADFKLMKLPPTFSNAIIEDMGEDIRKFKFSERVLNQVIAQSKCRNGHYATGAGNPILSDRSESSAIKCACGASFSYPL